MNTTEINVLEEIELEKLKVSENMDLTGKYVIDPTWETVAVFRDTDEYARIIFNRKDIPYYRVDIDGTVTNGRRKDYDSYVTLRTMRPKQFVKGEIGYSQKCAIDYVAGHFLELLFEVSISFRLILAL